MIESILSFLFGKRGSGLSEEELEISRSICKLKGLKVVNGGISIYPQQGVISATGFYRAFFDVWVHQQPSDAHKLYAHWKHLGCPPIEEFVSTCGKAFEIKEKI